MKTADYCRGLCPSTLKESPSGFSRAALRVLFDGKKVSPVLPLSFLSNDRKIQLEIQQGSGRLSLSGAQAKYSMVLSEAADRDGFYHLQFAKPQQRGQYILKPAPTSFSIIDRVDCPANEHLSMQLASQAFGISTAPNCLCFFLDGTPAYLTRRFDLKPDGSKWAMEDFASLGGFTRRNGGSDFKYCSASYEECADLIRKYTKASQVEILKFFRILLFDFLISNSDAHLKNFSLIEHGSGDYLLSPCYDLLNTFLHLEQPNIFALDKGLFREGMRKEDTNTVNRRDFEAFGRKIGLSDKLIKREIDRFCQDNQTVSDLVERSFLSPSSKILYWKTYQYRKSILAG